MSEPSNHEANKVLRVLTGERLKYTVRLHKPDGGIIEFQANRVPSVKFFEEDRCLWLHMADDGYTDRAVMKWIEGSVVLVEENK